VRQSFPLRGPRIIAAAILPAVILLVNILIIARLFRVEYLVHLGSIEGTFIALAREISGHFGDLRWWPLWDCGLPFQNTYLPLLHLMTGAFSALTGHSAALAYHQVCATLFAIGPVCLYFMAWRMTRQPGASFLAALAYSLFSPGAWFLSAIRSDLGSPWNLRPVQNLVYYGEGPYIAALVFLPLAILFLYLAITERRIWHKLAAGLFAAVTVLVNAFGASILAIAAISLLAAVNTPRWRRNVVVLLSIAAVTYAVVSPLMPPSVIAAIRTNSPTLEGDYRYTARSFAGLAALAAGFLVLWASTRRLKAPALRFFLLYAFTLTAIVWLGVDHRIYVVPQPHRYEIAMEMALITAVIFGVAHWLRHSPKLISAFAVAFLLICVFEVRHDIRYARGLIRGTDITATAPYRIARWMDEHMGGERVMVSGSHSLWFNDFTETPQLHGGHDAMQPNSMMGIIVYALYAVRDGANGILWLKALGAHAIVVPGPGSSEYYKPFANPSKFEGLLPVLWRKGGDTIYAVPARSASLAHVVPADVVVRHAPVNGLDTVEVEQYVKALEDPSLPEAELLWKDRHTATIRAQVPPGDAVSVQLTYVPGWRATVGGASQKIEKDGLGLLLLRPSCQGACEITLTYSGGPEWRATCALSLIALAGLVGWIVRAARRAPTS
jgi:hypothetical protein